MSDLNAPLLDQDTDTSPSPGNHGSDASLDDREKPIQQLANVCDDDDDNQTIVVQIKEGCERDTLNTSTTAKAGPSSSTTVNSKDGGDDKADKSSDRIPKICNLTDGQINATKRTDNTDDKPSQHKSLQQSDEIVGEQSSPSAIKLRSGLRSSASPQRNIQMGPKQHQHHFLKSQSLDLHNDDCAFLTNDPKLAIRPLPDISEHRTTDQSASEELSLNPENGQISVNVEEPSTSKASSQLPTQRPNPASSLFQNVDTRPIYPNVPYSPYGSPFGSPRSMRRRPPLRESRRISIEKSGSFLQLNQYKLMDQIGQGSYGLVKLAYSEEDSTHYAMKILSKKKLLRQAALMRRGPKQAATSPLDRVYREIAVLKKLDHPNIVKLVEVLDDPLEDSLYMVFELVKKGEVLSIPTDKPLSEDRAWNVFRDSLLGLEYLHYQKIIHADLKPGNLLLTECGHVKIADLGVCNEFLGEDAIMSNGSTAGTPAFRAPETLVLGKTVYCGRAADIWALGATLYSLVFGKVPFLANSIPALYDKIKSDEVVFPETPQISDDMRSCILRMLEKDAAQRITLPQLKMNQWVTNDGKYPLPTEDENCCLVQVDEEDINSVVRSIPKLDTLILIKTMLKNHSFVNPFSRGVSGRAPQPGGSRLQKFVQAGRSNSAPGSYHMAVDRQPSADNVLPSLSEHCPNQKSEDL